MRYIVAVAVWYVGEDTMLFFALDIANQSFVSSKLSATTQVAPKGKTMEHGAKDLYEHKSYHTLPDDTFSLHVRIRADLAAVTKLVRSMIAALPVRRRISKKLAFVNADIYSCC
jgi:hypothetical protein